MDKNGFQNPSGTKFDNNARVLAENSGLNKHKGSIPFTRSILTYRRTMRSIKIAVVLPLQVSKELATSDCLNLCKTKHPIRGQMVIENQSAL